MAKGKGGFIGQDGLNAPDQATGVTGTAGDTSVSVAFTAPSDVGGAAVTGYRVQSNNGIGASGSASPITVTGLTNGTSYTFNVWAINAFGWSTASDASGSVSPSPQIGLFGGAYYAINVIDEINIATTGNATDFGDLTVARSRSGSVSSSTRGIWGGGDASGGDSNVIDYVTIASAGNATDFGDVNRSNTNSMAGCSNSTRGLLSGGNDRDNIDYITISSTGNTTNFGNMTQNAYSHSSAASSTRGVFFETNNGGVSNVISYVTISSTGNATDFGDLGTQVTRAAACASGTKAFIGGGTTSSSKTSNVQEITIATTGNSGNFGSGLAAADTDLAALASATRAVWGGGDDYGTRIQFMVPSTGGSITDFGDFSSNKRLSSGLSSAHGGLS